MLTPITSGEELPLLGESWYDQAGGPKQVKGLLCWCYGRPHHRLYHSKSYLQWEGSQLPALVNPDLMPFLNLHVNLHAKKKFHLKVRVNLEMKITFMGRFM